MIKIDGIEYKVVETLPYFGAGMYVKVVETASGERTAVKALGKWRFWDVEDRLGRKGAEDERTKNL